jgi:hypothetical protein
VAGFFARPNDWQLLVGVASDAGPPEAQRGRGGRSAPLARLRPSMAPYDSLSCGLEKMFQRYQSHSILSYRWGSVKGSRKGKMGVSDTGTAVQFRRKKTRAHTSSPTCQKIAATRINAPTAAKTRSSCPSLTVSLPATRTHITMNSGACVCVQRYGLVRKAGCKVIIQNPPRSALNNDLQPIPQSH